MSDAEQPLGEVIQYLRGITFKPNEKVEPTADNAVVCMRTKNVQDILDESDLIAVPSSLVRRDELYLRTGDILMSSANSWNLVGKVCRVPQLRYRATAGGFISVVRARDTVDSRYLYHWLASPAVQQRIRRCARQTTNISNLSVPQFEQLLIPVPPLAEQSRIADILDKADAIRRKRKEAIALTEALLRSAFLEMFGDPVTNPKGWAVKTLEELDADFSYGTSTRCTDDGDGRAVLRIPNVVGGEINYSGLKYAKIEDAEAQRFSPAQGDIVFVRSNGNPNYIARSAVFRDAKSMLFASYLIRARLPARSPVLPEFVHSVFSADSFREQLLKEATTTAGNYNINTKSLGRQRMPLPPLEMQERFMSAVEHTRAARGRQEHYGNTADTLFNSLVARAFSGGLSA